MTRVLVQTYMEVGCMMLCARVSFDTMLFPQLWVTIFYLLGSHPMIAGNLSDVNIFYGVSDHICSFARPWWTTSTATRSWTPRWASEPCKTTSTAWGRLHLPKQTETLRACSRLCPETFSPTQTGTTTIGQVWSITQLYSLAILQSTILEKIVLHKHASLHS